MFGVYLYKEGKISKRNYMGLGFPSWRRKEKCIVVLIKVFVEGRTFKLKIKVSSIIEILSCLRPSSRRLTSTVSKYMGLLRGERHKLYWIQETVFEIIVE